MIGSLGGELLVNNSWSGSCVTKLPNREELFPSGCSDERTSALHNGLQMPEVIIVYLGTNDWANGILPRYGGEFACGEVDWEFVFEAAYCEMLKKLKHNYPAAQIFCCTLCAAYMSQNPEFVFNENAGGINIKEYNAAICRAAESQNCRPIDLYKYAVPYDSIDGTHPNKGGMSTLADLILREMLGEYDA